MGDYGEGCMVGERVGKGGAADGGSGVVDICGGDGVLYSDARRFHWKG